MHNNSSYLRYTWFVLVFVFLVILAGGIVRMTQSGMGCPDWPTCFGKWIPPTSADELPPDFEKYLKKQDIDHSFNVYHTWIEAINRYLGALLGIFILIHFVWTVRKFRKQDKRVVLYAGLLLVAIMFQGWLGKEVVAANLAVVKITTHMLVALLLAAIPLLIIFRLREEEKVFNPFLKYFSILVLLLTIIQVVLGTQVREQVDDISKSLQYQQRELWIAQLDDTFLVHRSMSWLIAAGGGLLFWKARMHKMLVAHSVLILLIIVTTIALGVIMNFLAIPAVAQPLHLLFASLLALSLFAFRLRLR